MAAIHVLSHETIDKIAAGEVVERPASIVKELVENAIDAGATAVTVEIKEGGIRFIRVSDNGCGIKKTEIRKAFLRHATSKIQDADDLLRLHSLGFRGEALSSISAVSNTEMTTKTADDLTGVHISMSGAAETDFEEVGAPEGTTIIVRDLFFNVPARRKFLKQPATEGGYVADLMEHLALANPGISFQFIQNNQVKFSTAGNGNLKQVIYKLYGKDMADALIEMDRQGEGIRLYGYLGKPSGNRSNRNYELYFMNGRFIKSKLVSKAIEEGYKSYLMQHRYPFCVLMMEVEPSRVDVNVHPAKMEVRFTQEMQIFEFLSKAVREVLDAHEMIPEVSLTEPEKQEQKEERLEPFQRMRSALREERRLPANDQEAAGECMGAEASGRAKETETAGRISGTETDRRAKETGTGEWISGAEASGRAKETETAGRISGTETNRRTSGTEMGERGAVGEPGRKAQDFSVEFTDEEDDEEEKFSFGPAPQTRSDVRREAGETPLKPDAARSSESVERNDTGAGSLYGTVFREVFSSRVSDEEGLYEGKQMDLFEEKILSEASRPKFRILGQVFDTYWIVVFEDKLLMIDQHAAHEKVKYERIMKAVKESSIVSQYLYPPLVLTLSGREQEILSRYQESFEKLGFELEYFGGREITIRSAPADLFGSTIKDMFLEVLDELSATGIGRAQSVEDRIATMACKAAVKGNMRMSVPEMEALLDELLTLDNPYFCPHGRPTIISFSRQELEKKFKRIV